MSAPLREASIHFQLLIIGTLAFFAGIYWALTTENKAWRVEFLLMAIAAYLAFSIVVFGHRYFGDRR